MYKEEKRILIDFVTLPGLDPSIVTERDYYLVTRIYGKVTGVIDVYIFRIFPQNVTKLKSASGALTILKEFSQIVSGSKNAYTDDAKKILGAIKNIKQFFFTGILYRLTPADKHIPQFTFEDNVTCYVEPS